MGNKNSASAAPTKSAMFAGSPPAPSPEGAASNHNHIEGAAPPGSTENFDLFGPDPSQQHGGELEDIGLLSYST